MRNFKENTITDAVLQRIAGATDPRVKQVSEPDEIDGARALQACRVARAISMDGTRTDEQGIGLGKIGHLADERGDAVDVMRAIKMSLDPNGLMNPAKTFLAGACA